jgi:hypothetical protein
MSKIKVGDVSPIRALAVAAIRRLLKRPLEAAIACALTAGVSFTAPAAAQVAAKPNILVIWGDDIGWYNISAYNLGVMGYQTPNIDRIAK